MHWCSSKSFSHATQNFPDASKCEPIKLWCKAQSKGFTLKGSPPFKLYTLYTAHIFSSCPTVFNRTLVSVPYAVIASKQRQRPFFCLLSQVLCWDVGRGVGSSSIRTAFSSSLKVRTATLRTKRSSFPQNVCSSRQGLRSGRSTHPLAPKGNLCSSSTSQALSWFHET